MTTNTLIDLQEADSLNQMDTLRHWVSVDAGYQRSMRLDRDASDAGVLAGYVAQTTCLNALQTMATHINSSRQRSFTWTGPYGCGKSSLALVLSSLLGKGPRRDEAARILSLADEEAVSRAFASREGWKQILMVGRQASLTDDLAERLKVKNDGRAVVQALEKDAEAESEGFILMIDELGKYLEAENASENAYLLQEIAEAANRSSAKFVFLGILHQAVDVYASKLPRTVRDEWPRFRGASSTSRCFPPRRRPSSFSAMPLRIRMARRRCRLRSWLPLIWSPRLLPSAVLKWSAAFRNC